jgi:uncharacterized protein
VIVLDTGGLYAFLDRDDANHDAARAAIEADPAPFVLSPFVLAELDYLVQRRLGVGAECDLLDDVDVGVYTLVAFGDDDLGEAAALVRRYNDLGIGLTDASVVVLAGKYRTADLLCTDEQHFRAIAVPSSDTRCGCARRHEARTSTRQCQGTPLRRTRHRCAAQDRQRCPAPRSAVTRACGRGSVARRGR